MKICIVTPSFNGGGAERIAVNLANEYKLQGYEVHVVVFKAKGPNKDNVQDGINIIDLNCRTRNSFFKLLFQLRAINADVVLSVIRDSNIIVGLASIFLKSKIIFREANTLNVIQSKPMLSRFVYKKLMKIAYSLCDKVIANSNDTKNDLIIANITNEIKCVVIGNPVFSENLLQLSQEEINHPWFADDNISTVINIGRLHFQKNQQLLIRAFKIVNAKIPCSRLVIIGEGGERESLIKLINEHHLNDVVEILDYQTNPYKFYANADLFVLTSRWEGFGNVLVEAMACKTPIIATNCPGGPKDILQKGQLGDLVAPAVELLAEKIIANLLTRQDMRVSAAYEASKKYNINHIASEYLKNTDVK